MYLSWIIPTLNEERRVAKTLHEVDVYLRSKNFKGGYEIIVVDSSSHDRTLDIVRGLQGEIPHLEFISVENRGKGWAVREGMLNAQGDIRLFSDADNSTSPEHFEKMTPFFDGGCVVVISSRNPRDAVGASQDIPESFLRIIAGKVGNLLIQLFAVPGIWDTQNGFKAFRAEAAKDLFSRLRTLGFAFDIEILALARKRSYKTCIIPVRWRYDPASTVTFRSYLKVFIDLLKIRRNIMMNKHEL